MENKPDKPKTSKVRKTENDEQNNPNKKDFNSYKRSSVSRFSSMISIFIMLPAFAVLTIFMWLVPKSQKSEIEKRNLASFPTFSAESYFSGEFTRGVNNWFTDTTPFRDDMKNMGNSFKGAFGISTEDTVNVVGNIKKVNKKKTESSKPEKSKAQESKTEDSKSEDSKPEESKAESQASEESKAEESSQSSRDYTQEDADYTVENGVIVVKQDGHYRGLELFGGGTGNSYVEALNTLRGKLDEKIKIYSMIAPLASEYYTPANYSDFTLNQKEYFDDIASRLDKGITSIDIDTVLAGHVEEPIYCRTDHHWMSLGAYYACQEFAKTAGVDFKDLSTYKAEKIEGFVGTMYAFSGGDINIKNDPEDFIYYVPDNYSSVKTDFYDTSFNYDYTGSYFKQVGDPQSNAYLTFFGGDEQVVKIRTNVKNGRKLIVIKDSYGNAEPGFYMNSFEEIYIVDMRYFNVNLVDFINQMGITDVLFTMVTYSAFGGNADNIMNLITQNPGQNIVDNYDPEA